MQGPSDQPWKGCRTTLRQEGMTTHLVLVRILSFAAVVLSGCTMGRAEEPVALRVTMCELTRNPERYSGRQVAVRARMINPQRMVLEDGDCGRVLLAFPADQQVRPKAKCKFLEDNVLQRLMEARSELVPPPTRTPGRVSATFHGRFDSVFPLKGGHKVQRDPRSMRPAVYEFRLVLRRVTDVSVEAGK